MMFYKDRLIQLPTYSDFRGSLTVIENLLPFIPKRIYWIYDADDQTRGGHRHIVNIQALIAINGTVEICINDGMSEGCVVLGDPNTCLVVHPTDWHTMTFRKNAVLLVFASELYNKSDYIDQPY
jgi:hypothetical protein